MIYGMVGFVIGVLVGSIVSVATLALIGAATKIKEAEEEVEHERRKHNDESERIRREHEEHAGYIANNKLEWKSQSRGE